MVIDLNNIAYSFLVSSLAGLSTLLGSFLIFFKKTDNKILAGSLSFAAGVMITVSLTDLIPSSYALLTTKFFPIFAILLLLVFLVIGIILSMMIDKYLPSDDGPINMNKNLYRVGIFSMLAIILHNIPEGIATFMASSVDRSLGLSLALAISLHNIPEGISISVPIYYATKSKKKALFSTFISGISEPLGAVLAYLFLSPFISDMMMGCLFSMIAGIMIHISVYELLPTASKYKLPKILIIFLMLGIAFMSISHFLF